MTKQWNSKQQSECSKDDRIVNRLQDKRTDFEVVEESDKEVTYHVRFQIRAQLFLLMRFNLELRKLGM
jgi:hypothetical protein